MFYGTDDAQASTSPAFAVRESPIPITVFDGNITLVDESLPALERIVNSPELVDKTRSGPHYCVDVAIARARVVEALAAGDRDTAARWLVAALWHAGDITTEEMHREISAVVTARQRSISMH